MRSKFLELIKKLWHDPVWSKVIASIILGIGGLIVGLIFWPEYLNLHAPEQSPKATITPETSESKASRSQEPITLFKLFQTDFTGTDRICVDWAPLKFDRINKSGGQVEGQILIHVRQCFDFAARSHFLVLLIPFSPHTFETAISLSSEYRQILSHLDGLVLESKNPGEEITTSEHMSFGRSIVLYYEDLLTYEQLGAISTAFKQNGINVQLRGLDYLQSQILQRSPVRSP